VQKSASAKRKQPKRSALVALRNDCERRRLLKRNALVALKNVSEKKKELKRNALVVPKSGPVMPRSGLALDPSVIANIIQLWLPSLCKM
jgi:hypothetical protein